MIKLSIIIPIYNAEKFLKHCLESVIVDSKQIEYILINDGSTDASLDICNSFAKNNEQINVINNSNHGVSYSRNCGIKNARGKFLMFVDSDDVLFENWFKNVSIYFEFDYDIVCFNKNVSGKITKDEMYAKIVGLSDNCFLASPCSKLYKTSLIKKNKIKFNTELINGEDLIFNLEVLNNTEKYTFSKNSIYKYRIVEGSSTKKFNDKIFRSDLIFQNFLDKALPKTLLNRENMLNYSIQNACFIIMQRLSYIRNYREIKRYFHIFEENPYLKLKSSKIVVTDKKVCLVLFLIRYKLYYLCYMLFRIKQIYSKDITERFVEI